MFSENGNSLYMFIQCSCFVAKHLDLRAVRQLVVYPERRHDCRVRVPLVSARHTPAGSSLPSSAFLFPTLHSLVLRLLSDSRSLLYYNSLLQLHYHIVTYIHAPVARMVVPRP